MYDVFIEYNEECDLLEHEEMMGMIECGDDGQWYLTLLLSNLDSSIDKFEKDKVDYQPIGTLF
jgi:hypothetical protein